MLRLVHNLINDDPRVWRACTIARAHMVVHSRTAGMRFRWRHFTTHKNPVLQPNLSTYTAYILLHTHIHTENRKSGENIARAPFVNFPSFRKCFPYRRFRTITTTCILILRVCIDVRDVSVHVKLFVGIQWHIGKVVLKESASSSSSSCSRVPLQTQVVASNVKPHHLSLLSFNLVFIFLKTWLKTVHNV